MLSLFIGIVVEAMEEAKNTFADSHNDSERLTRRMATLGIEVSVQQMCLISTFQLLLNFRHSPVK
jgi:hypothetical protein